MFDHFSHSKSIKILESYYSRRAQDYESIYHRDDPVRRGEQLQIATAMNAAVRHRRVVEIACGTGYWSAVLVEVVEFLVAVDASAEMLAVAQAKQLRGDKVRFQQADAYRLGNDIGMFNGGVANFWFSHIPKSRIQEFLNGFHAQLLSGAHVFLADNVYVPGLGGELIAQPREADTFKLRTLPDGSQHEVLKNYYDTHELQDILAPRARDLQIHMGECFWWLSYTLP